MTINHRPAITKQNPQAIATSYWSGRRRRNGNVLVSARPTVDTSSTHGGALGTRRLRSARRRRTEQTRPIQAYSATAKLSDITCPVIRKSANSVRTGVGPHWE